MRSMNDRAETLMLSGIAAACPDCRAERIFMPVEECDGEGCEFCCTSCGAAVMIDPVCDYTVLAARVA